MTAAVYARRAWSSTSPLLWPLFALIIIGSLTPSSAAAGAWVVIQPDSYVGPPGLSALWHAIRYRNTWVVITTFDNQRECMARARQDVAEGMLPLPEFRARRVISYTDEELLMLQGILMASRCMPIELAEKVGTLRVSDQVR